MCPHVTKRGRELVRCPAWTRVWPCTFLACWNVEGFMSRVRKTYVRKSQLVGASRETLTEPGTEKIDVRWETGSPRKRSCQQGIGAGCNSQFVPTYGTFLMKREKLLESWESEWAYRLGGEPFQLPEALPKYQPAPRGQPPRNPPQLSL